MHKYAHVMAATDFSAVGDTAAGQAVALADHYRARLTILHVVEHFPEHLPHYRMSREDMDPQEFLVDRATKDLQALCARLGRQDAELEVRLTPHSAKSVILQFARDHAVDLIVLGARGHHGLADLIAGSTATGVVRSAHCSVLTVRIEEP